MLTNLRFGGALLALTCMVLGSTSNSAAAVTVEVARHCKALTDAVYPPREPGNPAAGSLKGDGRVAQDYFRKCVANGGKMDEAPPTQAK
jgi:hypothetical protein